LPFIEQTGGLLFNGPGRVPEQKRRRDRDTADQSTSTRLLRETHEAGLVDELVPRRRDIKLRHAGVAVASVEIFESGRRRQMVNPKEPLPRSDVDEIRSAFGRQFPKDRTLTARAAMSGLRHFRTYALQQSTSAS
jgi:hypothetical protein